MFANIQKMLFIFKIFKEKVRMGIWSLDGNLFLVDLYLFELL